MGRDNMPGFHMTSTPKIEPLVEIRALPSGSDYRATCRDCGELGTVALPQTATQAGLVQQRHLADHLTALAEEITLAAR